MGKKKVESDGLDSPLGTSYDGPMRYAAFCLFLMIGTRGHVCNSWKHLLRDSIELLLFLDKKMFGLTLISKFSCSEYYRITWKLTSLIQFDACGLDSNHVFTA